MSAYMASLDKLLGRPDAVYWPTHGPAITEPQPYVRAFVAHRREREAGILECLAAGPQEIMAIVDRLYVGLAQGLRRAAARSVHAHLLDLAARGLVDSDGPPTIDGVYRAARR
jgi:glyoxylase-like metal-dependent hydrolase (beta-lactamase superfamily II)